MLKTSSWWEGTPPLCTDFTTLSPSLSSVCSVFLFLKENVEVMRWESWNLIPVNSNNHLSHSSLWHWCALLVSRNTGVLFCVCVPPPNKEKNPHLANEETFWDNNKCWQKIIVSMFLKSQEIWRAFAEGGWYQVCWTLSMWHLLSLPKNCTEKLTSNYLSGHKPFPLTPSLWRK